MHHHVACGRRKHQDNQYEGHESPTHVEPCPTCVGLS